MSLCPSCNNETVTTHNEHGLTVCKGCSPAFCTECYWGAKASCAYFHSTVPELNWLAAEEYLNSHTDKLVRIVRTGPHIQCTVVRIGTQLFRRVERDGEVISETPIAPTECCVQCGSYDRRYTHLARAYINGFACTECANGILGI
jgi:hypothetical protein